MDNEEKVKLWNRLNGLAMIVFGEAIMLGDNPIVKAGGAGFVLEGAGDLVTGEYHYFSHAILNYYFPNSFWRKR